MALIRQCKDDVVSPHMALSIYTYTKAVIGEIPIDEVLITRIRAGGMPVFSSHRIAWPPLRNRSYHVWPRPTFASRSSETAASSGQSKSSVQVTSFAKICSH